MPVVVRRKSEIGASLLVVVKVSSLQTGKASVPSEPTTMPVDTEPRVAMLLPEVGLEEQDIQIDWRLGQTSIRTQEL